MEEIMKKQPIINIILLITLLLTLMSTSMGYNKMNLLSVQEFYNNDSPWPMFCHDVKHTGRSEYALEGNSGILKWRYKVINSNIY